MLKIMRNGNEDAVITAAQERNLRRLAARLAKLPKDYRHFDMAAFLRTVDDGAIVTEMGYELVNGAAKKVHECGTVACAVGHGPALGIKPRKEEDWTGYCDRAFIDTNSHSFDWCFGGAWSDKDNTPRGAAQRITMMLENGAIPDDAYNQRTSSTTPLSYTKVRVPRLTTLGLE